MNNNRGNNRRRGRGNNRQQGGQQLNRIDSRARGNAPQLLEKYRKLAHDSHLNGDRVQEEYYLQFADHYFRVLSDQKRRQDDARQRRDERQPDLDDQGDDSDIDDYGVSRESNVRDRYDAPEDADNGESGDEGTEEAAYNPPNDNPFLRDSRSARNGHSASGNSNASKPRKPRRKPRDEDQGDDAAQDEAQASFDPSILPPAISVQPAIAGEADEAAEPMEKPEAKPETKPRRRTRRASPPADDAGEPLSAVS